MSSANTIELTFNDINHLHEWLLATNLDYDQNGIQVFFPKENKKRERVTLADVNSNLVYQKNLIL